MRTAGRARIFVTPTMTLKRGQLGHLRQQKPVADRLYGAVQDTTVRNRVSGVA